MLQVGSVVAYDSASRGLVQAMIVKGPNADGTWDLDVKAGVPPSRIRCIQSQLERGLSSSSTTSAPNAPSFTSGFSAPAQTQEVLYRSAGAHKPVGTVCFYKSVSRGWIPARVTRYCNQSGMYDLDCKAQAALECIFWMDEGAPVKYYSSSQKAWISARVLRAGTRPETFDLDCKEAAEVQCLRPRGSRTSEHLDVATLQAVPGMLCYGNQNLPRFPAQSKRVQPGILTHVLGPKPSENAGLLTRVLGPKPNQESGILERVFGPNHGLFEWGEGESGDDEDEEDGTNVFKQVRFSAEHITQEQQGISNYDDVPLMTGAVDKSQDPFVSSALLKDLPAVGSSWSSGMQGMPKDPGSSVIEKPLVAPPRFDPAKQHSFRCEDQLHHGGAPPLNPAFQQQSFSLDSENTLVSSPPTEPKLQGCSTIQHQTASTNLQPQQFSIGGNEVSPSPFRAAPPIYQMQPVTFGTAPSAPAGGPRIS